MGVVGPRGFPGQDGLPGQPGQPGYPGKPVSEPPPQRLFFFMGVKTKITTKKGEVLDDAVIVFTPGVCELRLGVISAGLCVCACVGYDGERRGWDDPVNLQAYSITG